MSNTNASPTLFGWDFQVNAALILMLENIELAEHVRVEGKTEDIEIRLKNGKKIYSQAKSVVKSSSDFRNVKRNLKESLRTLSSACAKDDCNNLIYVTNSPNPLGDKKMMSIFYGPSKRSYNDLPPSSQLVIENTLKKIPVNSFEKDKLSVQVIPFETDNLTERYKIINMAVNQFVFSIRPSLVGITQDALDIWQKELFINGTMCDTEIVISKRDLIWPLIVLMTDIRHSDNQVSEVIDESDYEDLISRYRAFINNKCERFDFASKVLSDYQEFQSVGNDKQTEFINLKWIDYIEEFSVSSVSDELQVKLVRVVLYNIIRQKNLVSDIKKKVHI